MITFREYVEAIPLLHYWGDPPCWNSGGFGKNHFEALRTFMTLHVPGSPRIIETGAGNSTLFFLLHKPASLISIDLSPEIYGRIDTYCTEKAIDRTMLDTRVMASQSVLPKLAEAAPASFDFALIDGDHGWPGVMVDFCYMLALLKPGGFLMIDDIHIYAIKELARLLQEQPEFSMQLDLEKARVYRKNFEGASMPGWWLQPYIVKRTDADSVQQRSFSI